MTRHSFHIVGLALAGLGILVTAAAQADTKATDLDCATFLAMDEGQMNAVAAAVEGELNAAAPAQPDIDPNVLIDAGIDPSAVVATPPPMPGETTRVLQEACAAASTASLLDALGTGQPADAVAVAPEG